MLQRRWNLPKRKSQPLQPKPRRSRNLQSLQSLLSKPMLAACSSAFTALGSSKSPAASGDTPLRPILSCLRFTRERWRSGTIELMKETICKKQRISWSWKILKFLKGAQNTPNRSIKLRKRWNKRKFDWNEYTRNLQN